MTLLAERMDLVSPFVVTCVDAASTTTTTMDPDGDCNGVYVADYMAFATDVCSNGISTLSSLAHFGPPIIVPYDLSE